MFKLHIPDMSCGHCKASVQSAVHTIDQSATAEFDMDERLVNVNTQADLADVLKVLEDAGYSATPV